MSNQWRSTYRRRSVEKDVKRWDGWPAIERKREEVGEEGEELVRIYDAIFETGGRVTEVLSLKPENFVFSDDYVEVREMKLEKHYDKIGSEVESIEELPDNVLRRLYLWNDEKQVWQRKRYRTNKKLDAVRQDFAFPSNEPLAVSLREYVEGIPSGKSLFPSRTKPEHLMHRSFVYRKFILHGVYPHLLRGQRASCLRSVYHFDLGDLMDWFTWLDLRTAQHYAKMGTEDQKRKFREAMR